jgi:tellurite resistance protein TerC
MSTVTAAASRFVDLDVPVEAWLALLATLVNLLVADLLIVHRRPHEVTFRAAAIESGAWIALGLGFAVVLGWFAGGAAAGEYLSGYLIEKSLSIDNVFVWAVVFAYVGVPGRYQFRVLFWGIFGALALRAVFIFAGITLLERFDWILYVFGAFLLVTAVKIARHTGAAVHPERNVVLRLVRRLVPSTPDYDGQRLFTRRSGAWLATPLFVVLVLIETTDVVFAVDSIPAILAVSQEPFIVFAANAFAILGLRALYFCLAGMADRFRYLNRGLGVVLAFVGCKMLLVDVVHPPTAVSLGVIVGVLALTVVLSLRAERAEAATDPAPSDPVPSDPAPSEPVPTRSAHHGPSQPS